MRLEYVLQKSLGRDPHCFRAWVKGQGYVNDGTLDREDFYRQYHQAAQSEIENMGFAPKYAEPGYEQPHNGVLLANWNNLARGLDVILERMGYTVEWSDEWATCDDCGAVVRTEPDSYCWEPGFIFKESEGAFLCFQCWAGEAVVNAIDHLDDCDHTTEESDACDTCAAIEVLTERGE